MTVENLFSYLNHVEFKELKIEKKKLLKMQVYETKNAPSERILSIIVVYPRRWAQLAKPYYLLTQGSGLLSRGS